MNRRFQVLGGAAMMMSVAVGVAVAQQLTVDINKVSEAGVGEKIGTVTITENKKGTTFKVAFPPASMVSMCTKRVTARQP